MVPLKRIWIVIFITIYSANQFDGIRQNIIINMECIRMSMNILNGFGPLCMFQI